MENIGIIGNFFCEPDELYSKIYYNPQEYIDKIDSIDEIFNFVHAFLRNLHVANPVTINGRIGLLFFSDNNIYVSLGYGVVINKTIMDFLDFESFSVYYDCLVNNPCIYHNNEPLDCSPSCFVVAEFMKFFVTKYIQ